MSQHKTAFCTRLIDVDTTMKEVPLGCLRIEPDNKEPNNTVDPALIFSNMLNYLWRERRFRYVHNRSGGTLSKDALVVVDDLVVAVVTASAGAVGSVTRASGSFITDGIKVGDIIAVDDDAGGAGAAPEGEASVVTGVQALTVTFAPNLTAAVAASDVVAFYGPWSIKAAAAGKNGGIVGIPMADIPNGSYGWIQTYGIYPNATMVAAGTAVVPGDPLYPGTALLTTVGPVLTEGTPNVLVAGSSYAPVAYAVQGLRTDTVRRKAAVFLIGG